MSDGKLKVPQKTKRESEIEKFITHRSWRRYTECLEGTQRWGLEWREDRVQVEQAAEPGAHLY